MRLPKSQRAISGLEIVEAVSVFWNTLPLKFIMINDGLGYGNLPFTLKGIGLTKAGIALEVGSLFLGGGTRKFTDRFISMYLGPVRYANPLGDSATFIHEMTHVWQYTYGSPVVLDSLYNQAMHGHSAYAYEKGKRWGSYNVEQQASIVEDWYIGGRNEKDDLYHYIRDYVRKKDTGHSLSRDLRIEL